MPTIPNLEVRPFEQAGALAAPTYIDVKVLAANVAETVTVPTDTDSNRIANYVSFSSSADFYVNWLAAASVPAADIADGTGPELNPTVRYITRVGDFSVVSAGTCIITMAWYR